MGKIVLGEGGAAVEPVQAAPVQAVRRTDYSNQLTDCKILFTNRDNTISEIKCEELADKLSIALEGSKIIRRECSDTFMPLQNLDGYGKNLHVKIAEFIIAGEAKYILIMVNNGVHLIANIDGEIQFLWEGLPGKNLPLRLLNAD